jgi:hypothetical protein
VGLPIPAVHARGEEKRSMRKQRADALGALLSGSLLSCLFALLLVADQAFPPVPLMEDGRGLRAGIRSPVVMTQSPGYSDLDLPSVLLPPTAPEAGVGVSVADFDEGTVTSGAGEPGRGSGPAPRAEGAEAGPVVRGPSGGSDPGGFEPMGEEKDEKVPPGHGGTPPGHDKAAGQGGGRGSLGSGHGGVGTPPGHGGTPPGHGGTPPGQAKDKDHGSKDHASKGRGKGKAKD